jgi:hypothetical protein
MKAIIICDDFAFMAQAGLALRRAGSRTKASSRWTIKSWPVNATNRSAMADTILVKAADAHLIVIPARRAHSPPGWLREWLERWAALRKIQDAALAVIDDGIEAGFDKTVSAELTALARKHGLSLITDEGDIPKETAKLFVRLLREPGLPMPIERKHFGDPADRESFRGMGINE